MNQNPTNVLSNIRLNTNPTQNKLSNSNNAHLNTLRKVVKVLYDDTSYEILNYIINRGEQPTEELKLSDDMNISFNQVRTSLITMEKHGILISNEHKRKREDEEDDESRLSGYRNPSSNPRKNKTFEWNLSQTYYNRLKNRFNELRSKLEKNLEFRAKIKFECPKCKTIYQVSEAAFKDYTCHKCEDKPRLLEKKAEDVTQMRKKCNEILSMLSELFMQSDKHGKDFEYIQISRALKAKEKRSKANEKNGKVLQANNKTKLESILKNQNDFIISSSLEDPNIEESLQMIKKDEGNFKKFKEIVQFYTYGK